MKITETAKLAPHCKHRKREGLLKLPWHVASTTYITFPLGQIEEMSMNNIPPLLSSHSPNSINAFRLGEKVPLSDCRFVHLADEESEYCGLSDSTTLPTFRKACNASSQLGVA